MALRRGQGRASISPGVLLILWLTATTSLPLHGQAKTPAQTNPHVEQLVVQGQNLAAQARFAEAEIPLKQALQMEQNNLELLSLLGRVEGRLARHDEAISLLQRVVAAEPKKAEAHVNLAIALADAGKREEALKETSDAIELSPKLVSARLNKARLLADLHRNDEAEQNFSIAHQLAPTNFDVPFYWALLEKDRGQLEKQSSLFQQAVRLQPDNLTALMLLAQSLQQQSKDTEAIAVLRHMLQLKPDSENALYMLSMELRRTDPEQSKKLQEQFAAQKRKEADLAQVKSLGNQAYTAANKQDWPEAIRLLKQALEACTNCEVAAPLHKNLGLALCHDEKLEECRQELQMALKLNPNDPDVLKALDLIARRQ
jgi:tetratricopeptide (TPR) repeat protein